MKTELNFVGHIIMENYCNFCFPTSLLAPCLVYSLISNVFGTFSLSDIFFAYQGQERTKKASCFRNKDDSSKY